LWRIRQEFAHTSIEKNLLNDASDLWHEKCPYLVFFLRILALGSSERNRTLKGPSQKKGGQAKKQIERLQSQAASSKTPEQKRKEAEKAQREKEKAAAEAAKRETAELFKPVQVQKVPFGVDPKTVLCIFYKQGNCEKGKKCKFSHDLAVERKGEKKNLYQDTRDGDAEEEKKKDDMVDWDEGWYQSYVQNGDCSLIPHYSEKLRQVVLSKHGNPKTTTDKVCKFFIDAVENGKYGWFWSCPNGGDKCMYKHSLPPGYVLISLISVPIASRLPD
jgi:hypothetical protein